MKVLSFIPNSTLGPFQNEDAYWIEANQEEFMSLVYPVLSDEEKEKIDHHSLSCITSETDIADCKGHFYFLVNNDWSKTLIEKWSMPHSGLWDAGSPFRQTSGYTFASKQEFRENTYVAPESTNLVWFSELIHEKFPVEFARIQAILDQYSIEYRFLKGTRDIWCRDYMPIQVSEKDFVQFRYEPSYLETRKDLRTRSDPRQVNPVNGLYPRYSVINLDGGNVVRYKDKVMISARVYKENRNRGLSKEEIKDQLARDLHAHVIIIPEHPCDKIDHADSNVRFLDHDTLLINERMGEYQYWQNGMLKIQNDCGFDFIEIPWFTPGNKKDSLSAIGIYINFLEVGNLILLPKFEIAGNRDQEVFELFKELYPARNIEQVNINAIAEEGGLLNCITWNIKVPENTATGHP